jgi:uncharacterized protein YbjT (DUF2867 family)
MQILITGASGFVGSELAPLLLRDGHAVRALGRSSERVHAALARTVGSAASEVEVSCADVLSGAGLARALAGIEVAYYLIHSMERTAPGSPPFELRERAAAENFAREAAASGVRRIVYLGGLVPRWEHGSTNGARETPRASKHLSSRSEVEDILLGAVKDSVALRASIVIGARSRSFRLLVRLVERMPLLTLPAWQRFKTQPIDARDVLEMLAAAAERRLPRRSLEVGGPEILTYGEMLRRIAELMLLSRPAIGIGVNLTGFAGRIAAALAGEDPELVLPLMESLLGDLTAREDHAAELLHVRLHSFDSAVEHALREWEEHEQLAAR